MSPGLSIRCLLDLAVNGSAQIEKMRHDREKERQQRLKQVGLRGDGFLR